LCKSRKICDGDPGNDSTSIQGRKQERKTKLIETERRREVERKVKSMLFIFFDKEFVLAGQTVNSAHYFGVLDDCMKMCEDFAPNFSNNRTGCDITTTCRLTLHFYHGFF
jgi:hypothetical protein